MAKIPGLIGLVFTFGLGACAAGNRIQAPFDGFVCSKSSYKACLSDAQSTSLAQFTSANYKGQIGPRKVLGLENEGDDQDVTTTDKRYVCHFGHTAYNSSINKDAMVPLVFVSPLLVSQIEEQKVRLSRARESCRRVAESYDYQLNITRLQDHLVLSQRGSSKLEAEVELERLKHDSYGGRALTNDEADAIGVSRGTNVQSAIEALKLRAAGDADAVRVDSKKQTFEVDYGRMFDDAQLLIDTQLRELSRDYFVLDRSVYSGREAPRLLRYSSGSWVAKGTVVAKADRAK